MINDSQIKGIRSDVVRICSLVLVTAWVHRNRHSDSAVRVTDGAITEGYALKRLSIHTVTDGDSNTTLCCLSHRILGKHRKKAVLTKSIKGPQALIAITDFCLTTTRRGKTEIHSETPKLVASLRRLGDGRDEEILELTVISAIVCKPVAHPRSVKLIGRSRPGIRVCAEVSTITGMRAAAGRCDVTRASLNAIFEDGAFGATFNA